MTPEYIILLLLVMVVIGILSIVFHDIMMQYSNHKIVEQKKKLLEKEARYKRYEKDLKDL